MLTEATPGIVCEALDGEALEVRDVLRARVFRDREDHAPGDERVGLPAVLSIVQLVETTREEGGARQQNHREGELSDDEGMAEALVTTPARVAARAAPECSVRIEPQSEDRRSQSEGECREQTRDESPDEHAPVEGKHQRITATPGAEAVQPVVGPERDVQGADAAGERQQQRLDDQRPQHARSRGAKRRSHGELTRSGDRAREQEVREVGSRQ